MSRFAFAIALSAFGLGCENFKATCLEEGNCVSPANAAGEGGAGDGDGGDASGGAAGFGSAAGAGGTGGSGSAGAAGSGNAGSGGESTGGTASGGAAGFGNAGSGGESSGGTASGGAAGSGGSSGVAAVIIVDGGTDLEVTEGGEGKEFSLRLSTAPTDVVKVLMTVSDDTEGVLGSTEVEFTSDNWEQAQSVTLTAFDDSIVDDSVAYQIDFAVTSDDERYDGVAMASLAAKTHDNDVASVQVTPTTGLETHELGATATFTVVLTSEPSAEVKMTLASSDETEGKIDKSELTFTAANWSDAQTVTVTGQPESGLDGDEGFVVALARPETIDGHYGGLSATDVGIINRDFVVERLNVDHTGAVIDGNFNARVSGDGRFVLMSTLEPMTLQDTNAFSDVYVRERFVSTTYLLSADGPDPGDGNSSVAFVSADGSNFGYWSSAPNIIGGGRPESLVISQFTGGRRVVDKPSGIYLASDDLRYWLVQTAESLVGSDTNGADDVYLVEVDTGAVVERVSVSTTGAQAAVDSAANFLSAGGRFALFNSKSPVFAPKTTYAENQVFLRDRDTGLTEIVSVDSEGAPNEVPGVSNLFTRGAVSRDGQLVALGTPARLSANDANGFGDIYLKNRGTGSTTRLSVAVDGLDPDGESFAPNISPDGRYVWFYSTATNLVPADTNGQGDLFIADTQSGKIRRINVSEVGAEVEGTGPDKALVASSGRFAILWEPLEDGNPDEGVFLVKLDDGFWNSPAH